MSNGYYLCLTQNLPFLMIFQNNLLIAGYCLLILALPSNGFAEALEDSIAPSYQWGKGWNIPQANLIFGGYANASLTSFNAEKTVVNLTGLSIFTTWTPSARLRFFSESEFEDYLSTAGNISFRKTYNQERLYADYLASDTITARFGKFLTPYGRWNVIHAAPLVWTTSRPLITDERFIGNHAAGAMLTKRFDLGDQDLEATIFVDDSNALNPIRSKLDFDSAVGGRLNYSFLEYFEIGASYLGFQRKRDFNQAFNHLFGLDFFWRQQAFEILMELSYRHREATQTDEKGAYIQGVTPLAMNTSLVARYEYLNAEKGEYASQKKFVTQLGIVGLAWRPYTPLVVKAEYAFGSNNALVAPNGFSASVATFF